MFTGHTVRAHRPQNMCDFREWFKTPDLSAVTPISAENASNIPPENLGTSTPFVSLRLFRMAAARPRLPRSLGLMRRCRAKQNLTPFVTHRAATRALPPSLGLRSVPWPVSVCFFSLPLK